MSQSVAGVGDPAQTLNPAVGETQTPSTGLRHPSLRKMPESDARSGEPQTLWLTSYTSTAVQTSEFLKYLLFLP